MTSCEMIHFIHITFIAKVAICCSECELGCSGAREVARCYHIILPRPITELARLVTRLAEIRDLTETCAHIRARAVASSVFCSFPAASAVYSSDTTRVRLERNHLIFEYSAQLCASQRVGYYFAYWGFAVKPSPAFSASAHIRRSAVTVVSASIAAFASRSLRQIGTERIIIALCAHRHGAVSASPTSQPARGQWVHLPQHRSCLNTITSVFQGADATVEATRHCAGHL
mmetsp:Transcript_81264/g.159504  ORF Transcript_81264/g.159504 Transcript_81264/m.159504 type:complete len:229 (-) Transcript_81264:5572-6258(-)